MSCDIFEKSIIAFNFIENFTFNRLVSNIAIGQEFGQISKDRQRVKYKI